MFWSGIGRVRDGTLGGEARAEPQNCQTKWDKIMLGAEILWGLLGAETRALHLERGSIPP